MLARKLFLSTLHVLNTSKLKVRVPEEACEEVDGEAPGVFMCRE